MPLQLRSAAAVHRKVGMETYSGVLSIPEYLIIHRPKADYLSEIHTPEYFLLP